MNRRQSLKALTFGSLAAGALISCDFNKDKKEAGHEHNHKAVEGDPQRPAVEKDRDARLLADKFFTAHEMATVTVLANIIIPADEKSGNAEEAKAPEFIEFMMKDQPGYQTPIRGGLRWMDVECLNRFGKPFKDCASAEQTQLLDEIAWPEQAKPEMRRGVSFFSMFRNLVATGFWTSKIGIEDLGYQGNTANIWNGVPDDVLKDLGLEYDPNINYVTPEDRNSPMDFSKVV